MLAGEKYKVTSATTIHFSDASHVVAVWEKTLITVWFKDPSPDSVARMARIGARLVAESKEATFLSVIEPTSGPPDDATRAELAKLTKDVVSKMAAAVIVTEGSGFRAAVVRGVGVALTVLAPHKVPFKFAATVSEAASILHPNLPMSAGGATGLRAAVEELRTGGGSVKHQGLGF